MSHLFLSRVEHVERVEARVRGCFWAKVFVATALAFVGLTTKAVVQPNFSDDLTLSAFHHKIKLQVNGYTGASPLENFPVLVRVSESGIPGFHYADMSATNVNGKALGYDLAFFTEDGTRLAADQDTWDIDKTVGTTGEQLVWVKLPAMTNGTKFYMCYNVDDGVKVTNKNPWAEQYVGVWHMRETSGTVEDAAGHNLGAEPGGNNTANSVAVNGKLGKARQNAVSGAPGNLTVPSYSYSGTAFTVSGWFYQVAYNSNDSRLFSRKSTYDVDGGWETFAKYNKNTKKGGKFGVRGRKNKDGGNDKTWQSTAEIDLKSMGWTHLTFTYNGTSAAMYTNGVVVAAGGSILAPTDNEQPLGIGNYNGGTGNASFFGYIDECRFLKSTATPDWVKAEFDAVDNPSFVMPASPEVTWANPEGAMPGLTEVGVDTVVVTGSVQNCGGYATCAIQYKVWAGESEPENWTTITNGLVASDIFSVAVSGLTTLTSYNYKLRAVGGSDGTVSAAVSGSFTTLEGFSVTWPTVLGRQGVTNVLSHLAVVGGTIDGLGGAASCMVLGKFWISGDSGSEPENWTQLGETLSSTGDFSATVSNLTEDKTYSYKLCVRNNNGLETPVVSGTFSTAQGLSVQWSGDVEQPGVTNVAWNSAVIGGILASLGDVASCTIEYKIWTGENEPENWTTLGDALSGTGEFSATVSGLTENTVYNYRLRVSDTSGASTDAVSGTFTTPVGLAATWAEASGRSGVTNVLCCSVVVGGAVNCLGSSATCTIKGKFWVGASEPESWTTLGDALSATGDFSVPVSNLTVGTTYNYALCVVGSTGMTTTPVMGTFTTAAGLAISAAVSTVSYSFATLSGTVLSLGEATTCDVAYKVWTGASEPEGWTPLASGLGLNANFATTISGLVAGTTYSYKVRAVGDDGEETSPITGTFTTQGESGEEIGSSDTYFYDDGTNAYWVAKEFERYLPFTVTGYTGSETLTNFPVLVDVRKKDTNGFTYDDFYHTGGRDIVFVDEKGHVIPHEIDTWNPNGMSLIWVRLPEMNNGTKFTMCYRSPLVNPPADPGNAFEKYVGVWHMNETADGIVDVIDSTTNNLVGETHANSLAYNNGKIGYARRVAQHVGTSSTYGHILVSDHDDILRTGVGNTFTYSCWSKLAANDPGWAYLVSRKSEDSDKGWGIQYHELENEGKDKKSKHIRVWSGKSITADKNDCTLLDISKCKHTPTAWACWTFVYDNTNCTAYLDGEKVDTVVLEGRISHTVWPVANDETATYDGLVIGGQQVGTGALNGWVDECRYSKGIRSDDWIKAEYDSMLQVNTPFVTKGTQVGRGVESLVPVVVWEQGEDMPVTVVDVSYAYVQFAGTVTYCGTGADRCRIEYQIWADGEALPEKDDWTVLLDNATPGTKFSIPVFGLKQDMPYNFRIRAVNEVDGEQRQTREQTGSFRTNGNVNESSADGEMMRIDNRFVHLYRAGEYTFTTPDYVTNIEIIVVGGGGAGGYKIGGGGGGGGVFYSQSFGVTTSTTYRITVGRGGTAPTNTTTASSAGKGEYSTFSLDVDHEHPLISVPGGGGGGSCSTTGNVVNGSDGASGGGAGGKNDTTTTGASGGAATSVDGVAYGHIGGNGSRKNGNASPGTYAAGGGGGGKREGLSASSDKFYGGGAGGSGVASDILGETLYFGAGGGGGYAYFTEGSDFSKPGAGGSGIGGNAADVKNGTLATSGVENTGAGGGGGSMTKGHNDTEEYWQGGDGGDGVVIISYEVHGRDPVADEPRVSMTRCAYNESDMTADISYRVYWAGIQNDLSDILIHYSTVSSNELDSTESGVLLKVAESALGVGSFVFNPPEVGYTYWVRLVARKHASSYSSSEEIASFDVPAVTLNGATWTESKSSPSADYATVNYKLFETNETTHLYCYWSESRAALEGDDPPSGDSVYLRDLGANTGRVISSTTSFTLAATEGLDRNKTYYFRLASGDAQGIKRFLSADIVELDTAEKPITVLNGASWADSNVATVNFKATVGKLDPGEVELVALYGIVESDVKDNRPEANDTVTVVGLGFCSGLALDGSSPSATFPLWSETATNYYVRLALSTNVVEDVEGVVTTNRVIVSGSYSSAMKTINVFHAIEANTLIYIVTANPKVMCYGDEPLPLDYALEYAGQTEGWGWTNKYDLTGAIACYESTNPTPVVVSSISPSGSYPITQGTLQLEDGGAEKQNTVEGVETRYQYKLSFSGTTYTISNAVFTTAIEDVITNYTGDAYDTSELATTLSGVRNGQTVTYLYRVGGAGEWGALPALTDVGNYNVQFKATAPNHDDVRGSFMVTIAPAPLEATISAENWTYTGEARTPEIATNVTGLVRGDLNPLTCEFRDAAGEWQSEVPSFTLPGEYKLFFRVSAPNHATFTTNCTFTIRGWDFKVNMDGTTGLENAVDINVSDPGWLLRAKGMTGAEFAEDVYGNLNALQPNGLKLWQNYVIERNDLSEMLVATIHQNCLRVAPNCFELRFPDASALRNTGLDVMFRVDRKLKGESEFTEGALTEKYEVNVPLGSHDPTGLYIFNMVFVPTNELYSSQKSVISSVATVGVMRVTSPLPNAVVAVPWRSMAYATTNKVNVAAGDVVNPNGITTGDMILSYNQATTNFNAWSIGGDGVWNGIATVNKGGMSIAFPTNTFFALGSAFWLVRSEPMTGGETNCFYLIGRYTGEDYEVTLEGGTAESPGNTLVANPTTEDIDLNDLVFVDGGGNAATPGDKDTIVIKDVRGVDTTYYRSGGKWGCKVLRANGKRLKYEFVEGGTVPAGTGFWYSHPYSTPLTIKFEKFGGAE